jgi:hypothetical protein
MESGCTDSEHCIEGTAYEDAAAWRQALGIEPKLVKLENHG